MEKIKLLFLGNWHCGYEQWKNKPKFEASFDYYDGGLIFYVHFLVFWASCDYMDWNQ